MKKLFFRVNALNRAESISTVNYKIKCGTPDIGVNALNRAESISTDAGKWPVNENYVSMPSIGLNLFLPQKVKKNGS